MLCWLSDVGILILTIPNLRYYKTVLMLAEGHWAYEQSGIMARENIHFFTGHEIVKLLRLKVEVCSSLASSRNWHCLRWGGVGRETASIHGCLSNGFGEFQVHPFQKVNMWPNLILDGLAFDYVQSNCIEILLTRWQTWFNKRFASKQLSKF